VKSNAGEYLLGTREPKAMPETLSPEVVKMVNADFPEHLRGEAIRLLEACPGENGEDRVHLAVLSLARGDVQELRLGIKEAQTDWRDVLVAAEHAQRPAHWDTPIMEATARADGWLRCPACGWLFCLSNQSSWNGHRHRRCGQRLTLNEKIG
jgi:hypothetical protein